jgi:hypothetical protein
LAIFIFINLFIWGRTQSKLKTGLPRPKNWARKDSASILLQPFQRRLCTMSFGSVVIQFLINFVSAPIFDSFLCDLCANIGILCGYSKQK